MATLSDLHPLVKPQAHGAPEPLVNQAIIAAARDFAMATRCWRARVTLTVTEDTTWYDLDVPDHGRVFEFDNVFFDGKQIMSSPFSAFSFEEKDHVGHPSWFIANETGDQISFIPKGNGTAEVNTFLTPQVSPFPGENTTLPDVMRDLFGNVIASGAIARLLVMPRVEWSDPRLATMHEGIFREGKDHFFSHNVRGTQRASLRSRPHSF